jgi:hypothetical protein
MSAPWIELLAAVLRDTPRLTGALCRERAELFDAVDGSDAHRAAELCGRCPAREPCTAWANTLAYNQAHGVLAGELREWVAHPSLRREKATHAPAP